MKLLHECLFLEHEVLTRDLIDRKDHGNVGVDKWLNEISQELQYEHVVTILDFDTPFVVMYFQNTFFCKEIHARSHLSWDKLVLR